MPPMRAESEDGSEDDRMSEARRHLQKVLPSSWAHEAPTREVTLQPKKGSLKTALSGNSRPSTGSFADPAKEGTSQNRSLWKLTALHWLLC